MRAVLIGVMVLAAVSAGAEAWTWERSLKLDSRPPDLRLAVLVEDATPVPAAAEPAEASAVTAGATPEGSPVLAVDVFAAMGNTRVQSARWFAKPFVAVGEALKEVPGDVARHPWQWLTAGLVTWEAVDGGVSDLWDEVFGSDGDGQPKPQVANVTADITIEGDNNQLRDVAQTKDVSVAGDNNVIDFQRVE